MNWKVGADTENMGKPVSTTMKSPKVCRRSKARIRKDKMMQVDKVSAIMLIIFL
jgi:hypothetical protein